MTLTTRLAVAMILLVAIAVTAVGWLSFRSIQQALLPRFLDRIETHSRLVATDLQSHVRGARGDIAGFRAAAAFALCAERGILINPQALTDVRFGAHDGLKSEIGRGPKRAIS